MYTKKVCSYCTNAKVLLNDLGIEFDEIMLHTPEELQDLKNRTGWVTIPQIFIDDKLIGGFQELSELKESGKLKKILGQ